MKAAETWRLEDGVSPVRLHAKVGEDAHVIAKVYLTDPETRKRTPEMLLRAKTIEAAPRLLALVQRLAWRDGYLQMTDDARALLLELGFKPEAGAGS